LDKIDKNTAVKGINNTWKSKIIYFSYHLQHHLTKKVQITTLISQIQSKIMILRTFFEIGDFLMKKLGLKVTKTFERSSQWTGISHPFAVTSFLFTFLFSHVLLLETLQCFSLDFL